MSFEIKKVYTDNPYVDEIVYYTKLLGLGTVLKMQDEADKNETVESLKAGGTYISCIEDTVIFEQLPLTAEALELHGLIHWTDSDYETIKKDPRLFDTSKLSRAQKNALRKTLKNQYIENYIEYNSYYRMLNGLPPYARTILKEPAEEDIIPPELRIPELSTIDLDKPVYKMSDTEIVLLEYYGIIDKMIEADPINRQYMKYLGKKKIDYYSARRANRFDVLYVPKVDSEAIQDMYRDRLDSNKIYTLRTVYSEAFKYGSDYYDNFIAIFIVLTTMIDIISRVQEFIARKEIFDIRSVQYIFKSYGIPFYEEIPLKYQISMVKNLHTLLKYKSTSKCMVDICSLFGFDNIKVFKYYLLKDRKVDIVTKNYVQSMATDPDEKNKEEYELKFLKLPLDDDLDKYVRSPINYVDYDEITEQDAKWDGGLDHDLVVKEILKEEFNFARTKYISIDTIYELTQMSIQQSYFFNFLYDNVDLESDIKIKIPYIAAGAEFKIYDIFTLLVALSYIYNGVKDTIMETQSQVLYVNGFNFKADLAALSAEIAPVVKYDNVIVDYKSTKHAREQLDKFIKPTTSIPSFNEMMSIYVNNMEVRDELLKGMESASNKKIYDVYKKLYDALMTVELTMDHFKIADSVDKNGNPCKDFYRDAEGDATYSCYLEHAEPLLYSVILECYSYENMTAANQYIANVMDSIIYALEEFIDTTEFQYLFSNLPVMSSEAVKRYIATIINFYKSYKVDFLGINTIYTLSDRNESLIKIIDSIDFHSYFSRSTSIDLIDRLHSLSSNYNSKDAINLIDRLYMDISTWVYKHFADDIDITIDEKLLSVIAHYVMNSAISIVDHVHHIGLKTRLNESINLYSQIISTSIYNTHDDLNVRDKMWIWIDEAVSTTKQLHIKNLTIVDGRLDYYNSSISSQNTAVFIPDMSVVDIPSDINVIVDNGHILVTCTSDHDVPGEIIVN